MSMYYVLDGHKPVPVDDVIQWGLLFERIGDRRIVARTQINAEVRVSTVFLGIDHNFGFGPQPLLFETMIFGGPHDQYQERYATWEEAEEGHAVAVEFAESADE